MILLELPLNTCYSQKRRCVDWIGEGGGLGGMEEYIEEDVGTCSAWNLEG